MKSRYTNIVHNPRFSLWPYGASGFASTGRTAARWKLERNAGDALTVSRGTNSSDTSYDKYMRGAPNLELNITALDAAGGLRIRQFHEGGQVFGQSLLAMTVIASGPAGASFYFGAGDNYDEVKTLGSTSGGVPILVARTVIFPFDEPVYEYLRVTPFESPSAPGVYRLHHCQVQVIDQPADVESLELRPDHVEWGLISRWCQPISDGIILTGLSTTGFRAAIAAPPGGWRKTPVIVGSGDAVSAYASSSGAAIAPVVPAWAISPTIPSSAYGACVELTGFTGVTNGGGYQLQNNNRHIAYLSADYWD